MVAGCGPARIRVQTDNRFGVDAASWARSQAERARSLRDARLAVLPNAPGAVVPRTMRAFPRRLWSVPAGACYGALVGGYTNRVMDVEAAKWARRDGRR